MHAISKTNTVMNSTQLKVFHAVAKAGSFSLAAQHLSLTQPAVSDHVRKLEEGYGTRLFIRGPKGTTLTDIGRKLLAITERHAEAEAEARELLARASRLEEGTLTIGADAAVHILPAVSRFRARHPGVLLRLVSGNSQDLLERLRSFTLDAAVVADRPEGDDVAALPLRRDPLVALVSAESQLARRRSLKPADLAGLPLVLREEGSATRRLALALLREAGASWQNAMEVQGREACQEAVAQGLGLAIVSRGEVAPDQRIRALPLAGHNTAMEEVLAILRSRMNLRLIQAFVECAQPTGA